MSTSPYNGCEILSSLGVVVVLLILSLRLQLVFVTSVCDVFLFVARTFFIVTVVADDVAATIVCDGSL